MCFRILNSSFIFWLLAFGYWLLDLDKVNFKFKLYFLAAGFWLLVARFG